MCVKFGFAADRATLQGGSLYPLFLLGETGDFCRLKGESSLLPWRLRLSIDVRFIVCFRPEQQQVY